MSVVVTLSDGEAHVVPLGGAGTVAALVDVIHGTLALPQPPSAYELHHCGGGGCMPTAVLESLGAGIGTPLEEAGIGTPLEEAGIHGCDERVELRVRYAHVARAQLKAEGIASAAAADDALRAALRGNAVARLRQIAAAGLTPLRHHVLNAIKNDQDDAAEAMLVGDLPGRDVQDLFTRACAMNARRVASALLMKGADANADLPGGENMLHLACSRGHTDLAEMLVSGGADVNARQIDGETALHIACGDGNEELVAMLLSKGADVDARNGDDETALLAAVSSDDTDVARMLVRGGADVNTKKSNGLTVLHIACFNGNEELAELLVERGAYVNARNREGATALHLVCFDGRTELAAMLISNGADLNAEDKWGSRALCKAYGGGHMDTAEMLTAKGAEGNVGQPRALTGYIHGEWQRRGRGGR